MRLFLLTGVVALFLGAGAYSLENSQSMAAWNTYSNAKYGYEIQYPDGFAVWATGVEGKRDGATIRVGLKNHAAPTPVLDIRVHPKTVEGRFPSLPVDSEQLTATVSEIHLNGKPARETAYHWKANDELVFSEVYLDGVVFHFQASSNTLNFHETEWWRIISSFRLKK